MVVCSENDKLMRRLLKSGLAHPSATADAIGGTRLCFAIDHIVSRPIKVSAVANAPCWQSESFLESNAGEDRQVRGAPPPVK